MKELPVRKSNRLKGYDYSQNGAYFVTLCVIDKHEILGKVLVGSGFHARPSVELTDLGIEVQKSIEYIHSNNNGVEIQRYIIMPNHVHLIVVLTGRDGINATVGDGINATVGDGINATVGDGTPTLQSIIGRIKSYTTKRWNELGGTENLIFWQRSFHDHIIRNEAEHQQICRYIEENPARWQEDCYYK